MLELSKVRKTLLESVLMERRRRCLLGEAAE